MLLEETSWLKSKIVANSSGCFSFFYNVERIPLLDHRNPTAGCTATMFHIFTFYPKPHDDVPVCFLPTVLVCSFSGIFLQWTELCPAIGIGQERKFQDSAVFL